MPKPIIIFSQADRVAADAFSKFSKSDRMLDREPIFRNGKLGEQIKEENGPIFFMGHTDGDRKKIEGFKPKELAQKFADGINKEDRLKVQDLYLISCEAGLSPPMPSLAQQLSNALNKLGFTGLKVHAISQQNPLGMRVEVITRQGRGSFEPEGSMRAYAYTDDKAGRRRKAIDEEVENLQGTAKEQRSKMNQLNQEIRNMEESKNPGVKPLMNAQANFNQLKAEFDRFSNTYQAQSPQSLLQRVGNFVGVRAVESPPPVAFYKMRIEQLKFMEAYELMNKKLISLKIAYSEDSPAYKAAEELILALEPIYTQAKGGGAPVLSVALENAQLTRVEEAIKVAQEELPKHRGWFRDILEFFGFATDSGKKLSAITEVVSENVIKEAKQSFNKS